MNKNTKIWVKYVVGATILLLLLWNIYLQVTKQISTTGPNVLKQTGPLGYLLLCIGLMFANIFLEGSKWYLLTDSVEPIKCAEAFSSYLAGMACSLITPNRIGDYPGRILYLGKKHTFRYINVSVIGAVSQLSAIFLFGLFGLVYYNVFFPSIAGKIALALCISGNILLAVTYWNIEHWLPALGKIKWLRRFARYGKLLNKLSFNKQIIILGLSFLRFAIFAAQYLFLLEWMNVCIPLADGFCLAALFFWIMAVLPSVALAEIGIRGNVSLFVFLHFSSNGLGVLTATSGIWLLNLVLPSIFGSILIMRRKLFS